MSLAETEAETVRMETANAASGATDDVVVDADEDREIIGAALMFKGLSVGNDYSADAEVWIGSQPDGNADSAEDLGGKFFLEGEILVDSTNGHTYVSEPIIGIGDDGEPFDWNEDVTLTLQIDNGGSSTAQLRAEAIVYYREV